MNIGWQLPNWTEDEIDWHRSYSDDQSQMKLAVRLAELNVSRDNGGPFGAAILNHQGKLISVGINRVVAETSSIAHAEIMAILFAQEKLGRFRLHCENEKYTLAASSQPCAMCLGAVIWSGINRLLYGNLREDVEKLAGFDEGPVHPNWREELARRGIEVSGGLCRERARRALRRFRESGGKMY